MADITILNITSNKVPESWANYQQKILVEAAKDSPIITISRRPTPIGLNLLDTEPKSYVNFYKQILRGAKAATTPYVALCEDDTLYTDGHLHEFRPPLDTFAYNINRWSLYTWTKPSTYSWRDSKVGAAGIYPRELAVESLEERFAKYGDDIPIELFGELGEYEEKLNVTSRKTISFWSSLPIIQTNHHYYSLHEDTSENTRHIEHKRMGMMRAHDIPYWGKAKDVIANFS